MTDRRRGLELVQEAEQPATSCRIDRVSCPPRGQGKGPEREPGRESGIVPANAHPVLVIDPASGHPARAIDLASVRQARAIDPGNVRPEADLLAIDLDNVHPVLVRQGIVRQALVRQGIVRQGIDPRVLGTFLSTAEATGVAIRIGDTDGADTTATGGHGRLQAP